MANPYPMQPMQPMMQPPMGTGGGAVSRGPVVRRGTSKAVPVVVSAGLAIGVFCGLLFGLGVEKDEAKAATSDTTASTPKKADNEVAAPFQPERKDVKVPPLAPQVVGDKNDKSGSGAGTAAGSGSGSAATVPAKPQKVVGKLVIEVLPEGAAKVAKITVDGAEIEGSAWELDMTDLAKGKKSEDVKKEVKVVVKATGYRDTNPTKVELVAEKDTTLKIEMVKRTTSGTGNLPRPQVPTPNTGGNKPNTGGNKPKPPPCKKPPCGLIDI